jgi:hypothetical protein
MGFRWRKLRWKNGDVSSIRGAEDGGGVGCRSGACKPRAAAARRGSDTGGCTEEGGVTVRTGDGGADDSGVDARDVASGIGRSSLLTAFGFTGVFRGRCCGSPVRGSGELEILRRSCAVVVVP